jgi:hypothetical protein
VANWGFSDRGWQLASIREALLVGGAIVAGPIEVLSERRASAMRYFTEAACPVVLLGRRGWDAGLSRSVPVVLDAPEADAAELAELWREGLAADFGGASSDSTSLPTPLPTPTFRFTPEQVLRAARASRQLAAAAGRGLSATDVYAGARQQNAAGLERLARRVLPTARWPDLVLSPSLTDHMRELMVRCTARDDVLRDRPGRAAVTYRRGVTALFAGASGTGKTLSAEVLAGELGLDLYIVDLATVVDKYIGETEKNLDRIFTEADQVNAVLLFDEADALFAKRSEVRDSRDRYANLEIAYLLQLMERCQGLTILTTNLRSNLDEALIRRLDAVIDFGLPDTEQRVRLWRTHLGPDVTDDGDVDVDFLARAFTLSGGDIRNICLTASFLALGGHHAVGMADLVRATEREYVKLGRLCVESEFGCYASLLRTPVHAGRATPPALPR